MGILFVRFSDWSFRKLIRILYLFRAALGRGRPDDNYLMEYSHELAVALRACIHHHNIIMRAHEMMEDFLSPLILLASFQATLQTCNLAYVSSKPATLQETVQNLQYLTLTLIGLMIIGYAGNCIKFESNRLTFALARCPWHLCGGPFRRDIMMIMKNTARPMVLTGGKFFIMDFDKVKAVSLDPMITDILFYSYEFIFSF